MRVYFYSVCGGTDNCHNCRCKNIWRQKVGLVVISCHLLLTADRLELLTAELLSCHLRLAGFFNVARHTAHNDRFHENVSSPMGSCVSGCKLL